MTSLSSPRYSQTARMTRSRVVGFIALCAASFAPVSACIIALTPSIAQSQSSSAQRRERERQREEQRERDREKEREKAREQAAATKLRAAEAAARARAARRANSAYESRLDTTISVAAGTTIDVSMAAGHIKVTGWDKQAVEVHATSETGDIEFNYSGQLLRLAANVRGRVRNDNGDAELVLMVPRGSRVLTYGTTGDIDIIDVGGDAEARTMRGDVRLRGLGRRTLVDMMTGDLDLNGAEGSVRVTTLSGSLAIRDVRGDIDINCTSGDVELLGIRSSSVKVNATNADILFQGALTANGRYEFVSHSGDVSLTLPEGSSGTFEVQSFSGELHSRFPLTLLPATGTNAKATTLTPGSDYDLLMRRRQRLEFGGGSGAAISVTTFNGDINIDRGTGRNNN